MKKRRPNDRAVEMIQKSADKQGVRLQQANASAGCTTDSDCIEKLLKRGLKGREPIM